MDEWILLKSSKFTYRSDPLVESCLLLSSALIQTKSIIHAATFPQIFPQKAVLLDEQNEVLTIFICDVEI